MAIGIHAGLQAQSVEQRLNILEKELESLKLTRATKKYESVTGIGPAASGVYHSSGGLSVGGYGEAKYTNHDSAYKADSFDLHRLILYTGYRFNDWIILNTELEVEHAKEVFAEFAYVDFAFDPALSLALGLQLIPSGIINYKHEPTTFYSVNRPQTEKYIIPSTWRENGIMLHGEISDSLLYYRLALFSGGRAQNFSENGWIRGGRQKGAQARSNDLAGIVSLNFFPLSDLELGLSYYVGDNGQGEILAYKASDSNQPAPTDTSQLKSDRNRLLDANIRTHLAEAHFLYKLGPLHFRGLFARGWMSDEDTRAVNRAINENIGKVVEGAYLEAAFNIASFFSTSHKLYLFIRNEYLNTQKETVTCQVGNDCVDNSYRVYNPHNDPADDDTLYYTGNRAQGVIAGDYDSSTSMGLPNPANDRKLWVYGLAYFPHPNVVIKADWESWDSQSQEEDSINPNNNKIDRFNLSLGWIF